MYSKQTNFFTVGTNQPKNKHNDYYLYFIAHIEQMRKRSFQNLYITDRKNKDGNRLPMNQENK
jgi:hypothetical protein